MLNSKIYSEKIGVLAPQILLPKTGTDMEAWAVVACDQYTSEPDYWSEVEEKTQGKPSTLHLTFPEVYLEENGSEDRIKKINDTMREYIDKNTLNSQGSCMIFVDRKTSHAESRKGLMLAVDLEKYNYNKGSQTLIRATEGTVIDRLPPRIKIRKNASLELPHVMVLIDDPEKTVIEPLAKKVNDFEKVYDFELMMSGGHIKGYKIDDEETLSNIINALEKLSEPSTFKTKYQVGDDKGVLLFAVGDGNHSLASAKGHWEIIKKDLSKDEVESHPARFALVELSNVHDDGITFEPIHRVVFNVDNNDIFNSMKKFFNTSEIFIEKFDSLDMVNKKIEESSKNNSIHTFGFVNSEGYGSISVKDPSHNLETGTLQSFLDNYIKENEQVKIDYIHGEDVVTKLGAKEKNIGFYLPTMDKHDLFKTVIVDGVLPRKTFSMGEAEEKRFYLECRKIV
ncbi:DUF1015 domain-containing protein [Herbivorax sp. ANBcel31]|uniref:DUF1015 domain-containing protein n=1 Tax=Herbivorax sp. ANBcel31 TaxID=3069754 RepID=UPI0027B2BA97|nr:DUF1015 domain-containing protein [Herbivorax sp. ANBcel31]MDQ2085677.1 DUF1015 domain-containing protein [Herbivorax sp. ANBcel31]